jgi:hypothetical protein
VSSVARTCGKARAGEDRNGGAAEKSAFRKYVSFCVVVSLMKYCTSFKLSVRREATFSRLLNPKRVHVRIVGRFLLSSQSPILQCFPFACSTQPPCAFPHCHSRAPLCHSRAVPALSLPRRRESSTPPFWIQPRVRNILRHRKSFYQQK